VRRLRGRVRRPALPQGLGLTSLLDVLTNLIVFLLVTIEPAEGAPELELPATTAEAGVPARAVAVDVTLREIRVDGVVVVALEAGGEGGAIPAAARDGARVVPLYERLAGRAPPGRDDAEILLRCDRRVPFSVVRDVLSTAGEAGFGAFRLVAVQGGP
jgi:biopolymer transport protein ExbD